METSDLSTVTDEQLCRTAEMSGNPLMWELANRFRESSAIAKAAREAGLVGEDGKLRKIIGSLPITADGCVIGSNCELFGVFDPGSRAQYMKNPYIIPTTSHYPIDLNKEHRLRHENADQYIIDMSGSGWRWIGFFSTRSAAEAAAKGGGNAS